MQENKIIINWEAKFENKLGLNENDYNKILSTIINNENKENHNFKCISLDVPRTISEEDRVKNPQFCSNLEEILKVFCSSNGGLGYISGMSFIVKMILKLLHKNKILKMFVINIKYYLRKKCLYYFTILKKMKLSQKFIYIHG